MLEIEPKCLAKVNTKDPTFTNEGYIIPCCECEPPPIRAEFVFRGFYNKELHISNIYGDFDKIFNSEQWIKFRHQLFDDPENAPKICQEYCKKNEKK